MKKIISVLCLCFFLAALPVTAAASAETHAPVPATVRDTANDMGAAEDFAAPAPASAEAVMAAYNEIREMIGGIVRDVALSPDAALVWVEIADGYEKECARLFVERYGSFVTVTNDIQAMRDAVAGGGMDIGAAAQESKWLAPALVLLVLCVAVFLLAFRARLVPVPQTIRMNGVGGVISKKPLVATIKNSAGTPRADVYRAILKRLADERLL